MSEQELRKRIATLESQVQELLGKNHFESELTELEKLHIRKLVDSLKDGKFSANRILAILEKVKEICMDSPVNLVDLF